MPHYLININNREIKYNLKRSKKAKHMRMQISLAGGLEVILPNRIPEAEARLFIMRKKEWIDKHIGRLDRKEEFSYFGKKIEIIQNATLTKPIYEGLLVSDSKIYIKSSDLTNEQLTEFYEKWLYKKARKYLPKRLTEFAGEKGFEFKAVAIRRQKSRWGSCSSKKTISLNYRLMMFEKKVIDYVIIHELCHLKQMNHSDKFWKLVGEMMPDFQTYRKILKY